jgi:prophage regulatory protein
MIYPKEYDRILRLPEVMFRTGLGRTSIYDGMKAGTFVKSVHIGPRAVGWRESAIAAWIEAA